ncbi:MAG: hypothetical protein JXR60_09200 [Bacteroidales bacterium]|nr:hypothetical protein [Bacteroidales bacterium]
MEAQESIIEKSFETANNGQMTFQAEILSYIKEISSWAKFLSILGFVGLGLIVVVALFAGGVIAEQQGVPGFGIMFTIIYLLMALLYFFPIYYLFNFSSKAKTAIHEGDAIQMGEAFKNLKAHYKFIGILAIIVVGIYALVLVFGGLAFLAVS